MIESSNLPFGYSDYFSSVENLEQLRDNLRSLVEHDIFTLETLLESVQDTVNSESGEAS